MNAEKIYATLSSQGFDDWYKDTFQQYIEGSKEHSKEAMLEDIKYFFNLDNK